MTKMTTMYFENFMYFSIILINVKYDGDDDNGNRKSINQSGENPNGIIVLYNISDLMNY